jgi:hypothetical protein
MWGGYRKKQCKSGECVCVDPNSGVPLNDTSCLSDPATTLYSSYFGEDIQISPPIKQQTSSCVSERDQITLTLADREIQINLPLCASDGSYFPQQFRSNLGEWWCVDTESGRELAGQRGPRHTLPCPGTGLGQVLYDSVKIPGCVADEIARVIDENTVSTLTCENYLYTSVQCISGDQHECYCVTRDTGIPLSSSLSPRFQISCPDRVETPCLRQQFETCSDNSSSLLLPSCPDVSPECDPGTGRFLPLQCYNDTCYCVNTVSGQVMGFLVN